MTDQDFLNMISEIKDQNLKPETVSATALLLIARLLHDLTNEIKKANIDKDGNE